MRLPVRPPRQIKLLSLEVAALPVRSDLAALQTRLDEIANRPSAPPPVAVDIAPLQADIGDLKTRVAAVETSGKPTPVRSKCCGPSSMGSPAASAPSKRPARAR